ncbi:hypothetical protein F4604DRAFT_1786176 [Suillus subluteus]|nr:hypothetical protein F4604DRAFT_1786176 [Suillus subluteus]
MSDIRFIPTAKLLILTSHGQRRLQASFALSVIGQPFYFIFLSGFHSASNCARLVPKEEHWIWTKIGISRRGGLVIILSYPLAFFLDHSSDMV